MHLFFYATETNGAGQLLWNLHQDLAPEHGGEFFRKIVDLAQKLRSPRDYLTIAVLLASTQEELLDILYIRDLLEGVRIILILPDRNRDTIMTGHTLLPRFITCVNSNVSWVNAVLNKMLSNYHPGEKEG